MEKISIICVYNKTFPLREQLLKSLEIQKAKYELILIDNRNNKFKNAASALNYGGSQAHGEYLLFTHQDIIIEDKNWLEKTINQISALDNPGIIGVAGKTHNKYIRTNILHGIPPEKITPFNLSKAEEASTVDECLFIIPKKVFEVLQFDEKTCFDWHLYATDYLLSIRKLGYKAYIIPSFLVHASKGSSLSEGYYQTVKKLQKKHFDEHIIRNCVSDWYTYIPVRTQQRMKQYNKDHDNIKLNIIDRINRNRQADKNYHEIDAKTRNDVEKSGLFDADYYTKKYHIPKKYDPMSHFMTVGYKKDYSPSKEFDTEFYYSMYHDIKHVDMNPLVHYINFGQKEGRKTRLIKPKSRKFKDRLLDKYSGSKNYLLLRSKFNPFILKQNLKEYRLIKKSGLFDEKYYLKHYDIEEKFKKNPLIHYMYFGYKLGYEPNPYFNSLYYRKKYNEDKNPISIYLDHENGKRIAFRNTSVENDKIIEKSGLFDKDYYMKTYPETQDYHVDLYTHYQNIGFKKGFNPSEEFNTAWYLDTYPDVKRAGVNPLLHYLKYGQYEKRIPRPLSEKEAADLVKKIDSTARDEKLFKFDKDSPLVSIIILTRDGIDYLKTLFENFAETVCYPNYEIIVVDNDSSDDTVEYLKELSKTLPIKIIENKTNETFSDANNKGVSESSGEYVLLLNNDMEPIYGWLNHMMSTYLESPEIGVVGAKLIFPYREDDPTSLTTQNEGIRYTELNGFLNPNDGYIVPYNIKEGDVFENDDEKQQLASILGASLLIKKDLYEEVGGLDDGYFYNYEDIDLCFKIIEKGYKVIYNPKAKLYHYYQATRKDGFDLSPNDMKNRIHLYRRWNTWLCEKVFLDRLNNDVIFSEHNLKISYISNNISSIKQDPFIDNDEFDKYEYTERFAMKHRGIGVTSLGWEVTPIKHKNVNILIKNNSDISICDVPTNPKNIINNNVHQIKIALIKGNIDEWKTKELENYDLIFTKLKYYKYIKDLKNVYTLTGQSLFLQLKNRLNNLHKDDYESFNEAIKNYDFERAIPYGADYLAIKNSKLYDEEWYVKNYDISKDHLDPVGHYLKIGGLNGYNPGPNFSSEDYYYCNPDVKRSRVNPLAHYERYGKKENRQLSCTTSDRRKYMRFISLTGRKYYFTKKLFKTKKNQVFFISPWGKDKDDPLNENSQIVFDNLSDKYTKIKYANQRPHIGDYLELLHNILESKVIVIDQGVELITDLELKEDQKVINIWHACGAFKTVGYDSPVYDDNELKGFSKQFSQYSNFIVSSPEITDIYANAHAMDKEKVLGLGVPRTDIFYDENYKKEELAKFYEEYPNLKNKEIILYAPTFRDTYELDTEINWEKLSQSLDDDEVFIIKRHLMTKEDIMNGEKYDNIFYIEDVSLFTLMFASKLLITDYSSVIFEYSLLNRPVIHYCPDYERYLQDREFYLDFDNELYGEIIKNPKYFIQKIINKDYENDIEKLEKFKLKYMSGCDGHATERVVKLIESYLDE